MGAALRMRQRGGLQIHPQDSGRKNIIQAGNLPGFAMSMETKKDPGHEKCSHLCVRDLDVASGHSPTAAVELGLGCEIRACALCQHRAFACRLEGAEAVEASTNAQGMEHPEEDIDGISCSSQTAPLPV